MGWKFRHISFHPSNQGQCQSVAHTKVSIYYKSKQKVFNPPRRSRASLRWPSQPSSWAPRTICTEASRSCWSKCVLVEGCQGFPPSRCRTFWDRLTRATPEKGDMSCEKCLKSTHRKAVHGHSGSASDKLEQPGPHLISERENETPEPLDRCVLRSVLLVLRVVPPVLHVDRPDASQE